MTEVVQFFIMIITEVTAKSILSKSKISDYTINAYTGCQHACAYCYACFMKKYTNHPEPWGKFVDVKINAPELLRRKIAGAPPGKVWLSGVCDAYQPVEKRYELTRKCLELLIQYGWPVTVQTKSPLVLRDIDLLKRGTRVEVGFSIGTADERIRRILEPGAPPISERIEALDRLHRAGVRTFVMIAPLLPKADGLAETLAGKVDSVLIDRMNYHYSDRLYQEHRLEHCLTSDYFQTQGRLLAAAFRRMGIPCRVLF